MLIVFSFFGFLLTLGGVRLKFDFIMSTLIILLLNWNVAKRFILWNCLKANKTFEALGALVN